MDSDDDSNDWTGVLNTMLLIRLSAQTVCICQNSCIDSCSNELENLFTMNSLTAEREKN